MLKPMGCRLCGAMEKADEKAKSVLCPDCVNNMVAPPDIYVDRGPTLNKDGTPRKKKGEGVKYVPTGFPRGWHKKAYYKHTDGTEWSRGEQINVGETDAVQVHEENGEVSPCES